MAGVERKLTTIVAADVVGFSKLMGENEAATLQALMACRSIIDQIVKEQHGRVFGSAGDSVLAEFQSPVAAVICAREFQQRIADRNAQEGVSPIMRFRVGINIGDVIIEGDNLYGDGVNIAARLQTIAEPGGICVSSKVYEEVKRKIDIGFVDGGVQALKNIPDPISIYHVGGASAFKAADKISAAKPAARSAGALPTVAVGEIKAIGVGGEAADLAQGLIEDIREGCGQYTAIAVLAGPKSADEADFVLEGSIRASGNRLRLTFALMERARRQQVWSERYDRTLDDVLDLQDEISGAVVSAIRVRVKAQLFERLKEADNADLTVAELLDKAAGYVVSGPGRNVEIAAALRLAVERAPENSMALGMLGMTLHRQAEFSAEALPEPVRAEILALTSRAVALAPESYAERMFSAVMHYDLAGNFAAALREARAALERNRSFLSAQAVVGVAQMHLGKVAEGLEQLTRTLQTNKTDPHRYRVLRELAIGYFLAGRLDEAVETMRGLIDQAPDTARNRLVFAVLLQLAGQKDEAKEQFAQLGKLNSIRETRIGDKAADARFKAALAELQAGQ